MDELIQYMIEHGGFDQKTLNIFVESKITVNDVNTMEDEDLANLVPVLSDRLLIRSFCRQRGCKQTLIDKLALKLAPVKKGKSKETPGPSSAASSKPGSSRNAEKKTRVIEVGLAEYNKRLRGYKAVRSSKGGGARRFSINKAAKAGEILGEGVRLFFNGECSMNTQLLDHKMDPVGDNETVGAMYKKTKFKLLRFYVAVARGTESSSSGDDEVEEVTTETTECVVEEELVAIQSEKDEVLFGPFPFSLTTGDYDETILHDVFPLRTSSPLPVPGLVSTGNANLSEIQEAPEDVGVREVPVTRKITLHRDNVMGELIGVFDKDTLIRAIIEVEFILPNGEKEKGVGSGVWRDALTQFWKEFEERCTVGKTFKVPFLRHDFGVGRWEAIARVLVNGYLSTGYYPTFLSPIFMGHAVRGFSDEDIVEAFFKFIPEEDASALRAAIEDMAGSDMDDLLSVLETYQCRVVPTQDNIKQVIHEIGHKTLIQEPAFVAESWRPILKEMQTVDLNQLYASLDPTPKKVIKLLQFPANMSVEEEAAASHLKRYVRNLDKAELTGFLRFCTGSDLLCVDDITVTFSTLTGMARRPIAHTCGRVLQIPTTYDNFPDFRTEFGTVLKSDIWVMDIV